jgi:hypothetical protein
MTRGEYSSKLTKSIIKLTKLTRFGKILSQVSIKLVLEIDLLDSQHDSSSQLKKLVNSTQQRLG